MGTKTGEKDSTANRSAPPKRYDKDLIRERTLELLSASLGPPKEQGARAVWDCPACGKSEKYSVVKASAKGGCLVADCRLAGSGDVFVMLAGLEDLDYKADFLAVLARSYELLGLEPADERPPPGGRPQSPSRKTDAGSAKTRPTPAARVPNENRNGRAEDNGAAVADGPRAVPVGRAARGRSGPTADAPGGGTGEASVISADMGELLDLAARVYERVLELCPLESRDRSYLKEERGISHRTIKRGRFGTMTAQRASKIKATLQREFGRQDLLRVPGFSEDESDGRLKWTLTGNYILIPYHDAEGRVTTIEGRIVGEVKDRKYVTLRRGGNHLYVFPGFRPEDLIAVCEGAMGAIVAAECGLAVGAIMGCERFRASPSPEMLDGAPGDPLLELKGADFAGRTVPYIPDADDPPNPNVLRAAPKAARWIAEPQNGKAAVCLLPKGADLDEWLLSLDPGERAGRFAELLAGASPPEDDRPLAPSPEDRNGASGGAPSASEDPAGSVDGNGRAPVPEAPDPGTTEAEAGGSTDGSTGANGRVFTEEDLRKSRAGAPSKKKNPSGQRAGEQPHGNGSQPGLWDDTEEPSEDPSDKPARRGVSRGARKLRDEVYRALLEKLPPKEQHLAALEKLGVMRATAKVGRFASLNPDAARAAVAELAERFGAKRLLTVPGFEADQGGKVNLTTAQARSEEYVLIPCFDNEGLLAGVECLPFDHKSDALDAEETVPLKGAGSHLYVFAHYPPGEVEGFCEGPLGAMLAAQEDVVIGSIGGFRRYKAASGPGEGRQGVDAALPELEGVDLADRRLAYVPRSGIGESNARYHEAPKAARWLVERQGGDPAVVGLSGGEEPEDEASENGHHGPTSLGEWIRTISDDEAHDRLRGLFPESPARQEEKPDAPDPIEAPPATDRPAEGDAPPIPTKAVLVCVAVAATAGLALGAVLLWLRSFAGYVSTNPAGEPVLYSGPLGPLRRLADTTPFHLLYDHYPLVVLAAVAGLALFFVLKVRARHLDRWKASQFRLRDRWALHAVTEASKPPGGILTREEALWGVLAWPVGYLAAGWLLAALEGVLALAASLGMAPDVGPLVSDPATATLYAATAFSLFVLWRRRSIRAAETKMLAGKIRH